jgi:hypothetical protein
MSRRVFGRRALLERCNGELASRRVGKQELGHA